MEHINLCIRGQSYRYRPFASLVGLEPYDRVQIIYLLNAVVFDDWLSALENWVENGKVPSALPAAHPALLPGAPGAPPSPSKPFTRPVCAYPLVAKYNGTGDTADAANFSCVADETLATLGRR